VLRQQKSMTECHGFLMMKLEGGGTRHHGATMLHAKWEVPLGELPPSPQYLGNYDSISSNEFYIISS